MLSLEVVLPVPPLCGADSAPLSQSCDTLVTVRIKPDSAGRFGFNVKGGADQGTPILVTKVAPDSPADLCSPRLRQGDRLLYINGRDLGSHTHEQAVQFIRAAAETHSGELLLVVRQQQQQQQQHPDSPREDGSENHSSSGEEPDESQAESMVRLRDSLANGRALSRFDRLFRCKPGLSMCASRQAENVAKNRYRDISPYDSTRVTLSDQCASGGGDYINASHVDMRIPSPCCTVNRYIAAQGPLPNTCGDFWQMCWEQNVSLIVMLTASNERGRAKCHEYWPQLYETIDYAPLSVTCVSERQLSLSVSPGGDGDGDDSSSSSGEMLLPLLEDEKRKQPPSSTESVGACGGLYCQREFMLAKTAAAGGEALSASSAATSQRQLTHLQFADWPDHGTPGSTAEFLNFVATVRSHRSGHLEPVVVHCSAGIGRTGVLITMETAACLLEAGLPVRPLEIVRQMREQRAMLIQTPAQYKFVCEAILQCWRQLLGQSSGGCGGGDASPSSLGGASGAGSGFEASAPAAAAAGDSEDSC